MKKILFGICAVMPGGFVFLATMLLFTACAHMSYDQRIGKYTMEGRGSITEVAMAYAIRNCSDDPSKCGVMWSAYGNMYAPVGYAGNYDGFSRQEPFGWEDDNPRSFRLKNTTDGLYGRCQLDNRQNLPIFGMMPQMPIQMSSGIVAMPMLPPQTETYFIVSVGKHNLKCQLFSGPAPFQATHEMNISFQVNAQGGRTFHLHPDFMQVSKVLSAR